MKDFFFLKVLDRIEGAFSAVGVDYPTLRRILQIKLVMNSRHASTIIGGEKPEAKNPFLNALGLYAFLGLFIGLFMLFDFPLFLKMNLVFGMIIFIVFTTMISDFSSVLLDIQDKVILLTRPVDAKTLNIAKLLYIVYYLFSITMAIAGISLIAGLFKYGVLFFLTMLVMLVLICSFSILVTSILYFAILHLFSGEKLKDIINYFQIALSIFMVIAYQLIGRIFNFAGMKIQITFHWWNFLLPSSWFAAPFSIFFLNEHGLSYRLLALTGIVVPVIALILYIKIAAPAFERNLQKLVSGGTKVEQNNRTFMRKISGIICFNREEKVFFKFTCNMLKKERKLKLRLFPNLTLGIIAPFIVLLSLASHVKSLGEFLSSIEQGKYYLLIYFSLIFFSTLFTTVTMSEDFRGAWIYRAMPVSSPGIVLKGAMKAFLYQYIMPFYLLDCLIFIAIYGVKVVPDLILIFINMMVLMLIVFKYSEKELPFYKAFQTAQGASNLGMVFLSFALCGGLATVHYSLTDHLAWGLALNLGISLLLYAVLWSTSFRVSWRDISGNVG